MSEIWQLQTPLPTYECASSPTSTVTDSPPRLKARPAKKSPHLVCISPNGDLSDLAPPEVYPSGRDLFPIPWKHIDNFTCTAHIPSTAAHVSECDPGDANWVLVLDAFRGAGTYVDVFQGWLLARECGSDGETVTMAPRPVVAKICDILDLAPDDQELALRALEREGQLFNGPLAALQGSAVPLFYGLFEVTSDPCPPHLPLEMRMFVSIFEDCGLHATPEDEDWSFALMSEQDKDDLRAAVKAVHACGVLHNDLAPRNVLRREGGKAKQRLCLIDFGDAAPGFAEELAREEQTLEEALDLVVMRIDL